MAEVAPEAFFLDAPGQRPGSRYALFHPARGEARGAVLYVHPFAEEQNKSRRMAAVTSRALAQAGYAVLQVDLLGCGDSSGDFGDATWDAWVDDVVYAAGWLTQRTGTGTGAPLWLWGVRAGCLLAVAAAARMAQAPHFLFWQAQTSGKAALQQFLRLKLAGDLLGAGPKPTMAGLHAQLAAGETLEVAGHALSPALAQALETAQLVPPTLPQQPSVPHTGRVEWIELSAQADAELSPAGSVVLAAWQQAGWRVQTQVAHGPAFWQTVETETAPQLLAATLDALTTRLPA